MVISEARLSSCVALVATPVIILAVTLISGVFGKPLEEGIYFRAFGPVIYFVFYGGLAYVFYEFTGILRGRLHYVTYRDGYVHILQQPPIRVDQIRSVIIERKFLFKNLAIRRVDGKIVRIRGYLLQRDLKEIKNSIEMLQ